MVQVNSIQVIEALNRMFGEVAHPDTIVLHFMMREDSRIVCTDGTSVRVKAGEMVRFINEPVVGQGRGHGDRQRIVNLAGGNPDSEELIL